MADRRITPGGVLCIAVTLAALVGLGPGTAWSRPIPWEITADSMVHLNDPDSILAEGNVIVIRPKGQGPGGMFIRADWARYDKERGTIKARGNVYILSDADEITANSADMNLETETGTFTDSTIFMAETHMFVTGEEVVKTGEFSYTLKKGWATACKPEEGKSPPWSFTSSTTKLTVDGMAQMTNAVFHVKDAPLAYTPYFTFPAKTKRESGLLFPEWSNSSRSGFGLMVPVFLNVSPSTDITLYPGYLSKRGVEYGGEFRYVKGPDSHGTFMLSYLHDDLVDGADLMNEYKNDGLIRRETNRYWLRGKANHDFGDHLTGRLDLDLVSDQDYLQEFKEGSMGYTASNLLFLDEFGRDLQQETLRERESSLQLVKVWSNMVGSAEVRTRQNTAHDIQLIADNGDGVLEAGEYTFLPRRNSPLQALPRLDFTGRVPISGTRMSTAWDSEYVNYWRSEGVGAQRLDLHPKLISFLPRGGWLEGKVSGGARETAYQLESYGDSSWEKASFQDRQAYDFTGNMATIFLRDFDLGNSGWLEHLVRPNLLYEYITRTQELPSLDGTSGTDVYSYSGTDRRTDIFDSTDRLERKNWLTWQLNNYFTLGGARENGDSWNRNLGLLKILQTYDLRKENPESLGLSVEGQRYDWSDLRVETAVSPVPNWAVGYQTNLSMYGKGVTRYELINQYGLAGGHTLGLNYRYLKDSGMVAPYFYTDLRGESAHDLIGMVGTRLTETLTASYYLVKSFSESHTVESRARLIYQPACWMMELETSTTADDQRVMLIFSLEGVGRAFRFGRDL